MHHALVHQGLHPKAGEKALARSAYREATAYFEQARGALAHFPHNRGMLEQAVDLRLDLRASLMPLGEFDRVLACLNEAEALAKALSDQQRLGRVSCYIIFCYSQRGDHERAIEAGQRALTSAADAGDFAIQVQTHCFLGQTYYALGDYRQAIEVVRRNVASLEGKRLRERFGLPTLASVAMALYQAMGMTFWLPPAEAALAQLNSSAPRRRHGIGSKP